MQLECIHHNAQRFLIVRDQQLGNGPSGLLEPVMDRIAAVAAQQGCTLADAVFHRLWTSTRDVRDACAAPRAQYFSGENRTASSSFVSKRHAPGEFGVALDVAFLVGAAQGGKRIVDFDPPRRYAHYVVAQDCLILSGMAESGPTVEAQFAQSLQQIEMAFEREGASWSSTWQVGLFLEMGHGDLTDMKTRLERAVPVQPERVTVEFVEGLASPDKHLEIEAIARIAR